MEGFQNTDALDIHGCESQEKSTPLFILDLFDCSKSSQWTGASKHSLGDPPVEAQGKRKALHATARAALFLPTVLHRASTALGGLAARHTRAGKV